MVLTDHTGKKFSVHFWHDISDVHKGLVKNRSLYGDSPSQTVCTIHPFPCARKERPCDTEGAFIGIAKCSARDNYDYVVGRKYAFGRALQKAIPRGFDSAFQRRFFWDHYFAKTNYHGEDRV